MRPTAAADFVPPEAARRTWVTSSDGIRLNVEIHGPQDARAPTVVLIHGWTCSIPLWAPVIRVLRDDLRVVAYDLRGHGKSDLPGPGGYSTDALADDLEAVLDYVVPAGGRAVLAGHSMGGMTILAAAPRDSVISRVSGALLASTGPASLIAEALTFPFGGQVLAFAAAVQCWLLTTAAPVTPVSRAALSYLTLGPGPPPEVETVNAAIIQACDPRVRAAWGYVLTTLNVTEGVRGLDVPTQVLVGTSDRLTPPPHTRRIAEQLPRCDGLTELPGIGHMTPLEAPGVVAELIRKLAAGSQPAPRPASCLTSRSRHLWLARPGH
jgi:pimeloyl-ACP methyl ester carboxylesterase